ncbi:MAG: hypothetical protein Q4D96_05730 [Propionibacteriaceae bacterium]|nr:hypothetical protein [Propionibacteriaceae bacterium]
MIVLEHPAHVFTVGWHPEGHLVATGAADGARIWDATTGQQLRHIDGDDVTAVACSRTLWTTGNPDGKVQILDGSDLVATLEGTAFAWQPDGTRLAVAHEDHVSLWNATTGQMVPGFDLARPATALAWSPDGRRLIAGGTSWQGGQVTDLGHSGQLNSLSFSPDGARYVTSSHGHSAPVRDSSTGEQVLALDHGESWFVGVAWSPRGDCIVTGSTDRHLRFFHPETGELLRTVAHPDWVCTVAFNPSGTHLAITIDDDAAHVLRPFTSVSGGKVQPCWT